MVIIEQGKKYINRQGEIYFDVEPDFLKYQTEIKMFFKVRCISGYCTHLNDTGEAISNIGTDYKHKKGTMDVVKEYNPDSILHNLEILLRRIFI